MIDNFQKRKNDQLGKEDRSSIGCWDEKIKKLCNRLNGKKEYYTTSSCAGRAVLIKDSPTKKENLFLYRNHNKISFLGLKKELSKIEYKKLIYFKQEPVILHVACKTMEDAQKLVDKAKLVGWKNSGIIASSTRYICELRSTEMIQFPIMDKKKVLVDDRFLKIIVRETNKKLGRTWEKIRKLENLM